MRVTTQDFVTSFHSLTGATIGERRKNLFLLLNRITHADAAKLDFSLVQPKTPLEEKLKIYSLIRFKRVPDLLEVLKCENPMLIQKIVKLPPWFLGEAFNNVTGEQLVTLIFPYISFNAKVKMTNKLALHLKNAQQADEFFQAIDKKYGLYLASHLLPACSLELIMRCFRSTRIKPTAKQLITIVNRYPGATESLLKQLSNKYDMNSDYSSVFVYLARNNIVLFLKLHKEYNLNIRVGWRITNKFVHANKEDVLKNPTKYYSLLHKKQIAKSLKSDFTQLYCNMFPESLSQFMYSTFHEVFGIIKNLPPKWRDVNLLLSAFEKAYGVPLYHQENYATYEILEMLPVRERESKMTGEYKKRCGESEDKWMCYCRIDKSLPYLKQRISLSSDIKTRAELIGMLAKTCKLNDDKVALAGMCRYMVSRHRNDHMSVRLTFLRVVKKHFQLELLEEQHWTPINELIQIFTLNGEDFFHATDFLEAYIHYRLIHNLPVEEQLTKFLKSHLGVLNIIKQKPEYEKRCLVSFGEMIPTVLKETNLEHNTILFLSALIDWNKRHPEDPISLFGYSEFMSSVRRTLLEEDQVYGIVPVLTYCIQLKTNSEARSELVNLYLTKPKVCIDIKIINWLFRNEPLTIVNNIDSLTKNVLDVHDKFRNSSFWRSCQNYTHLDIPQKMVTIALAALKEEHDSDTTADNAVTALSCLMSSDDFKTFIDPYYPSNLRADSKSDEGKKLYKMQEQIGVSLRNLVPASLALDSILRFCKGDYLKFIQRSLYSTSSNVNEHKLPPFFGELATRAVSIRKHAMHLTLRVLDKDHIFGLIKNLMESEKNASLRKFIFKGVFCFFVKNPDDYSWELVKSNANAINVNDKEALGTLMQVEKIPQQYMARYLLFTWEYLDKLSDVDEVDSNKALLLRAMTSEVIRSLPQEFCTKLIRMYFFVGSFNYFQSLIQTFTCRYIIYCDSEQEDRLKSSFATLTNYVKTAWNNPEIRAESRQCVANFVKDFCLEYLSNKCDDTGILLKFVELWNGFFAPHVAFDVYLHLQFVLIFVEKLPVNENGKRLSQLCNNLSPVYGLAFVQIFSKKIHLFDKYFLSETDEALIENLIQPNNTTSCLALAILLIAKRTENGSKSTPKYEAMIEMLEAKSDPIVQLYLHNYFRGEFTSLDY